MQPSRELASHRAALLLHLAGVELAVCYRCPAKYSLTILSHPPHPPPATVCRCHSPGASREPGRSVATAPAAPGAARVVRALPPGAAGTCGHAGMQVGKQAEGRGALNLQPVLCSKPGAAFSQQAFPHLPSPPWFIQKAPTRQHPLSLGVLLRGPAHL